MIDIHFGLITQLNYNSHKKNVVYKKTSNKIIESYWIWISKFRFIFG